MIAVTEQPPVRCRHCHADTMACDVKRGLAGRECCPSCEHKPVTESQEGTTR